MVSAIGSLKRVRDRIYLDGLTLYLRSYQAINKFTKIYWSDQRPEIFDRYIYLEKIILQLL